MITMEIIEALTFKFWKVNGINPTHILMTSEQHSDFSKSFYPNQRIVNGTPAPADTKISVVHLTNHVILDVIPVRLMNSTHDVKYPILVRLTED